MLPQIAPLFPSNINVFYDIFCGGGNVGVNVTANEVICNDVESEIIKLFNYWKDTELDILIQEIEDIIKRYNLSQSSKYSYEYYGCNSNDGLSKYNDSSWRKLREDYNNLRELKLLYPLVIFTFNNYIKFDNDRNFVAGGCNKRDFNNSLKNRFIKFTNKIKSMNIKFINKDFRYFNTYSFNNQDFVYCDPPYLITSANYNKYWTEQDERDLLNLLDSLNNKNIKFALSNVLESKGKSNDILKEWSGKYNIHYLDKNYSNSNYQRKETDKKDIEVLITNY